MPKKGDNFRVTLKEAHLNWGEHRYKRTRDRIPGEGYIKIPSKKAKAFGIFNSNNKKEDNEYICSSADGFLQNVTLKASGSSEKGNIYAKQFQGSGDLKTIGGWYNEINAKPGDEVEVEWVSSKEIIIRKL